MIEINMCSFRDGQSEIVSWASYQATYLFVKRSRIERDSLAEKREAPVGQDTLPRLGDGIGQQLGHDRALQKRLWVNGTLWTLFEATTHNCHTRLPNAEQLGDKGAQHDEAHANGPSTDRADRQCRVVCVGDDGSDSLVRRVVHDQGGFNLHLVNELGVCLGMHKNVLVVEKEPHFFDSLEWETGIVFEQGESLPQDLPHNLQ